MKCEWEPYENKFKCKHCGFIVPRNTINRICQFHVPSMAKRVTNLAQAVVKHVQTGLKHCTTEQRQKRLEICQSNQCGLFKDGICAHEDCGCYIRNKGKFFDKLSWADSKCPVGLWGPEKSEN